MTKKSNSRLQRNRLRIPSHDNIASMTINHSIKKLILTTNDMLLNQIHRDGPRIVKSFDRLTKNDIAECSALFGLIKGLLLRHLPRLSDTDFKATAARLLFSASKSFVASIEVARHGYRRQYGAVARVLIETLATVIVIAVKANALEEFNSGTLSSTKCITWSKAVLPPLGQYWGMLSDEFVHIGRGHSTLESSSDYTEDDEALPFIISSIRGNVWLLHVVTELDRVFSWNGGIPKSAKL